MASKQKQKTDEERIAESNRELVKRRIEQRKAIKNATAETSRTKKGNGDA